MTTDVYRISFKGIENVLELRVMMIVQVFNTLKTTQLHTLMVNFLYMNYMAFELYLTLIKIMESVGQSP